LNRVMKYGSIQGRNIFLYLRTFVFRRVQAHISVRSVWFSQSLQPNADISPHIKAQSRTSAWLCNNQPVT
jgi:hypothetical protein